MLKTAYEMRISDCSSDVCSSDLLQAVDGVPIGRSAERFPDREERACDDGFVGRGLGRGGFDCSVPHCLEQRHVHHDFPRHALEDACETVDRKSVVLGKSVSVRVNLGGRRVCKKKNKMTE